MDKIDIDTATKVVAAAGGGGIFTAIATWLFGKRKARIDSLQASLNLMNGIITGLNNYIERLEKRVEILELKLVERDEHIGRLEEMIRKRINNE